MKLREIFRFEVAYQIRRAWFWLIFAVLTFVAFLLTRDGSLAEALRDDFFINSPFAMAKVTVVGGLLWLVVAGATAGEAAARDVATGIHPLTYTTPIGRTDYLGGRFLAALALNALLLLAVQLGAWLGVYLPGLEGAPIGPFRAATYLTNYAFLALPNALFVTAVQFWLAARSGRPMAAYVGSFLLIFSGFFIASILFFGRDMGKLLDPIGVYFVLSDMSHLWTTWEKSWRLVTLEGVILRNRLLWLTVGAGALALTWTRFRFAHPGEGGRWWWRRRRSHSADDDLFSAPARVLAAPVSVPRTRRAFGLAAEARKTWGHARSSFRAMATSWAGIGMLVVVPLLSILVVADQMNAGGARLIPTTALVLLELTGPLSDELSRWIFVPFLIVFFAGELIWRERDAGMDEISDATPRSQWVPLLGNLLGLALLLALFLVLLMGAGMAAQAIMGHTEFRVGLYLTVLFGLQLPEYLLFVPLALAVHVLVDQKYVGHLLATLAYVVIVLAPMFGIEHTLLIYGASPGWTYTEMRGFGPSLTPWLWFKAYWAGWALLLAVAARLLWVRGRESGLRGRLASVRGQLTGATAAVAMLAAVLVVAAGGFVLYNTNILNDYRSSAEIAALKAEYERRLGQYRDVPQPHLAAARLHLELHPHQREADVRGVYTLVNRGAAAIDAIHLAMVPGVETDSITFDRPAALVPADHELPHRIYTLGEPLQPGDSMRLDFRVRTAPRGFDESGADVSLAANGTSLDIAGWLPALGYQVGRELTSPADRREHGLPPRPMIAPLHGPAPQPDRWGGVVLETVVGTAEDQVAVAPGALRRSWLENGRRYFRYVTDGAIGTEWAIASARYAVREIDWEDPTEPGRRVDVRIHHDPGHTAILGTLEAAIRASLDYYTREFGPYPYSHLTFIERPGNGSGMHADASVVTFSEGTALWKTDDDPASFDFPFAVVAHEMAHQWTVPYASVEGAPVMSESVAWYYAIQVVEETYGSQLHELMQFMRGPYPYQPIRRGEPLLRGVDPYMAYRRGPFALHALSEYVGEDRVNGALRRLLETHRAPGAPPATTLDLYRELTAVTPDSLRSLLHDLFEVNTFWELEAERVTAEETEAGTWQVTLGVRARKVVADSAGVEEEVPMDEWVEVGVFARPDGGGELSAPIYLEKHRIRSGEQTIILTVPRQPFLAGIDPHHLLDWEEGGNDDNIEVVRTDG